MAKTQGKCKKCRRRLVLATIDSSYGGMEARFDQEPFESEKIEPVIVDGQEQKTVEVLSQISCYICPICGMVGHIGVE